MKGPDRVFFGFEILDSGVCGRQLEEIGQKVADREISGQREDLGSDRDSLLSRGNPLRQVPETRAFLLEVLEVGVFQAEARAFAYEIMHVIK